ncbi:uncharacterized protein [Haliotis asinina]|uniref:uncharacterized protein n=1 Tax=Haliotis asinina TaxID=109174 RepID=UPI00353234CB
MISASCYCVKPEELNLMKKQLDNATRIQEGGSTHHATGIAVIKETDTSTNDGETPREGGAPRGDGAPVESDTTKNSDKPRGPINITEKACLSHPGYSYLEDNLCFRFSAMKDVRKWEDGRKSCQKDGGDLMTFYSQQEVDTMKRYLNDLGEAAYDSVSPMLKAWVGRKRVAGKYLWVTNSTFSGGWGSGEPMDFSIYKCVSFMYDGLGDGLCSPRLRYLCRILTDTTSSKQGDPQITVQ